MQMTAPFEPCGVFFARGDFDFSLYSSLARSQRSHGGKSTFGLKIARHEGASFRPGPMVERGCFNHLWPFRMSKLLDSKGEQVALCGMLSCVISGTLYQVLRIHKDSSTKQPVPLVAGSKPELALHVGGPIRSRCICSLGSSKGLSKDSARESSGELSDDSPNELSEDSSGDSLSDSPEDLSDDASRNSSNGCVQPRLCRNGTMISARHEVMRLDMQVFQGTPNSVPCQYAAVSLKKVTHSRDRRGKKFPGCCEGTYRADIPLDLEQPQVIVAAFRLRGVDEPEERLQPPSSEVFYKVLGVDLMQCKSVSNMWKMIFLEREQKTYSSSEHSEVCLVARCLEKILHVDLVSKTEQQAGKDRTSSAIVSDVFLMGRLDLKAFL
jgi:hypothetical protein